MTSNQVRTEIQNLLELFIESDVAVAINPVVQQNLSHRITRVTWRSPTPIDGVTPIGEFATITEYCIYLEAQAYSAVLYDGAILQLSYDFRGNELVGHRLCYYPCPFDVDKELLRSEPLADVIALYRGRDNSLVRLRSPLRFDYDPRNITDGHPVIHLHLLCGYCRWAVVAPLSLGHFIRFIFRHFYPNLWAVHEFLREWPQQLGNRTITVDEERMLHVGCLR